MILFQIGNFTAYSYGLMIAIGVIFAFVTSEKRADAFGLSGDSLFTMGIWGVIGGVIGGKLFYIFVELPEIIEDPSILLNFSNGFLIYGSLIGGVLAAWIYCKVKKIDLLPYLDIVMAGVAAAQGFGRIGCFLAGCCYGKPTDSIFGVVFPDTGLAPAGVKLIPTQLISSGLDFLNAVILVYVHRHQKWTGMTTAVYMILYSIGRFFVEFLRGDPRGSVGVLSTSQFIGIFIFIGGVALLLITKKIYGKNGNGGSGGAQAAGAVKGGEQAAGAVSGGAQAAGAVNGGAQAAGAVNGGEQTASEVNGGAQAAGTVNGGEQTAGSGLNRADS
ncbi:MAG: prolipoprotein diacylglyceryl transferase [Lachnospiraceae bacterium]